MPEQHDAPKSVDWYRERWARLTDLIPASTPEAVASRMHALRSALTESGLDRLEDTLQSRENADQTFERELGVTDPEAIVTMVRNLSDQLDELYTARRRLAALDLTSADDAVEMVRSMQQQLELLYERQTRLTKRGVNNVDHALAMIDNMEDQLTDLYQQREANGHDAAAALDDQSLLPHDTLHQLDAMDAAALNDLPVGAFLVDADGRVRRANAGALDWPGLAVDAPSDLEGTDLFGDVAPGLDAHFVRDRLTNGAIDTCFLYTRAQESASPTTVRVHLHPNEDTAGGWMLFRRL